MYAATRMLLGSASRDVRGPKRLTAGSAGAKEASSGAVGPGEALGTLVTISGYVKRPRYARLNTPMGADGAVSYFLLRFLRRRDVGGLELSCTFLGLQ